MRPGNNGGGSTVSAIATDGYVKVDDRIDLFHPKGWDRN